MTRIGVFGCAHLGYSPRGLRRRTADGINVIENDGYAAHEDIISDMRNRGVDLIVDAGDTFHTPRPAPRTIERALRADELRGDIPRVTIPGNHDRRGYSDVPASAVFSHRPDHTVVAPGVATDKTNGTIETIVKGYYVLLHLDEVVVHFVNEQALSPAAGESPVDIDPRPIEGTINLLVTHGIVPTATGLAYHHGADERGGMRVIPADWFNRGFDYALLADFHTPLIDTETYPTPYLYTGSAVRRGFSDEETVRGWAQVDVVDGDVEVTYHAVDQRPAVDIDIDAEGLTCAEIISRVDAALASTTGVDQATAARTGDGGMLVRVTVTGAARDTLPGLTDARARWNAALPSALSVEVRVVTDTTGDTPADALKSIHALNRGESTEQALRRLASTELAPVLSHLDADERAEAIELAASAVAHATE